MQIVIDINEDYYEIIKHNANYNSEIIHAIANGTPLPKGHGDLIDRSEVIKSLFDYHNGKKTIGQCIEDVQTIIEVDKGSEDNACLDESNTR